MRWCNTKMKEKDEYNMYKKIASYPEWPGYKGNVKKNVLIYCDIIMM